MTDVDVSVIIAVGPSADLAVLNEQLTALVPQLAPQNAELILSDNGRHLTEDDLPVSTRIRIVDSSDQRGPSHARNVGARDARGNLLLFCDSDDIASPDWLREMRQAGAEYELIGGRLEYDLLNGADRARWNRQTADRLPTKFGYYAFAPSCNLGVRAVDYHRVGGFDESLLHAEDIDLCWRLQRNGGRLGWVPGGVIHYRLRTEMRAFWRQAWTWGRYDATLLNRHRKYGARRTVSGTLIDLGGVLYAALQACRYPWGREKFVFRLAALVGRIAGTVRERTWTI